MAVERRVDEQGWFWLPGTEDSSAPGRLIIDDATLKLELLGTFATDPPVDGLHLSVSSTRRDEIPVVQGVLRSGHFFTLVDCVARDNGSMRIPTVQLPDGNRHRHTDVSSLYAVHDVAEDSAPSLRSVRMQIPGIAATLSRHRGVMRHLPHPEMGVVPVHYPEVPPLEIRHDSWSLSVDSLVRGADEHTTFEIEPAEAKTFDAFAQEVVLPLLWLARFTQHSWQSASEIEADVVQDDPAWPWSPISCPSLTRASTSPSDGPSEHLGFGVRAFVDSEEARRPRTPTDHVAFLDPWRTRLIAGWLRWFSQEAEHRSVVVTSLGATIAGGTAPRQDQFRSAIGAIELLADLHADSMSPSESEKKEGEEREQLISNLREAGDDLVRHLRVDRETVAWAADALGGRRGKGLARRISELIEMHHAVIAPLLRPDRWSREPMTARELARALATHRGRQAHGTGGTGPDRDAADWLLRQAQVLVIGIVMAHVIGNDDEGAEAVKRLVTVLSYS